MFDAVVRCGTIGRAAAEIGMAQPSVTLSLTKLESEVGEQLVTRGPGGVSPTAAGLILHQRVERMLGKIEAAAARLFGVHDAHKAAAVMRNLTGAQVRDHLAVDATGSFRAAAAALGVAAPTLNRSLRNLKEMVGTPLYRRTPSGFTTTAVGARFARDLRVALVEIDQALDEIATARGDAYGRISIGCLPQTPKLFLAETVSAVIRQYPGVEISLQEDAYTPLAEALRGGGLDMVIGALRYHPAGEFKETPLFADPHVLVVRQNHPLPSGVELQDAQLAELSWLIPWRDTPRRELLETIFSRFPQRPHVVMTTSSLAMIKAILVESDSLTLLARSQISMEEGDQSLRILKIEDTTPPRVVGVTTRQDWLPTPVQSAFIQRLIANTREQTDR